MSFSTDALSKLAMAAATSVDALSQSLAFATEEQFVAAQAAFCALDQAFMRLRRAADTGGAIIRATNVAGSTVATFRATLQTNVSNIRSKIAGGMGCRPTRLQVCHGDTLMEDHKSISDYTSSLVAQVTVLVLPLPRPNHAWDFCNCQADVPDTAAAEGEAAVAHLERGASSSPEGVQVSRAAHVRLDPWRFGGATSVELRLVVTKAEHGAVVAFKDRPTAGPPSFFALHVNQFRFLIGRGPKFDLIEVPKKQVPPLNTFFHVVLTYANSVMQVFIDGALVGSKEGCLNADLAMADTLRYGGADDPRPTFFGTVSFLRVYHGTALDAEDISDLSSIEAELLT
mmetsp:Transcript_86000/g.238225  ORF Transcript_86000/g.238225 Transcript_86000/m.238225 type:complete len:342 (-) Transcript_86000:86-1111(-)